MKSGFAVRSSVDIQGMSVADAYKLLIGAIVPRPIAWVSTISPEGVTNLAPFSFFNGVCANPPSLLFCPVDHPDGREKDTLRNIRATRQFVVNLVSHSIAQAMNDTAQDFPAGVSEFQEIGLAERPSEKVRPPSVEAAPASLECELLQIIDIPPENPAASAGRGHIVVGKLVHATFAPNVWNNGKVDLAAFDPVARLAGHDYCRARDVFTVERKRR